MWNKEDYSLAALRPMTQLRLITGSGVNRFYRECSADKSNNEDINKAEKWRMILENIVF